MDLTEKQQAVFDRIVQAAHAEMRESGVPVLGIVASILYSGDCVYSVTKMSYPATATAADQAAMLRAAARAADIAANEKEGN